MVIEKATDVRKEWSYFCDKVTREKPVFIKRTRDKIWMSDLDLLKDILEIYSFNATRYIEPDGSITLSSDELDLIENGLTDEDAKLKLGAAILEYAEDYYAEFELYSRAPNRKAHIPYIIKALIIGDGDKIGRSILCHDGKKS